MNSSNTVSAGITHTLQTAIQRADPVEVQRGKAKEGCEEFDLSVSRGTLNLTRRCQREGKGDIELPFDVQQDHRFLSHLRHSAGCSQQLYSSATLKDCKDYCLFFCLKNEKRDHHCICCRLAYSPRYSAANEKAGLQDLLCRPSAHSTNH
ncbi:hypothetical protein AOLI_G00298020 [Acnodon oligacanthus]